MTSPDIVLQGSDDKKTPNEKKDKKKKATVRSIDLPVESKVVSYSRDEINAMVEKEVRYVMIVFDYKSINLSMSVS